MNCGLPNHWVFFNEDIYRSGYYGASALGGQNTVHKHIFIFLMCARMVIFHQYGSSRYCHLQITYRCITSLYSFCLGQIQSCNNSTLVTGKVVCLLGLSERIIAYLGGSVLKVDITGMVKKNRMTSGFGFQVIIGVSLCVSGPYTLQIYCGTWSEIS